MIIYKATNLANGKIYIGQTTRSLEIRIAMHLWQMRNRRGSFFHSALKRYGRDGFSFEVIDHATSKAELDEKERSWIAHCDSYGASGYNLTSGGEGSEGYKHTPDTIMKMSTAQRSRFAKEPDARELERRIRVGAAALGRKHSDASIEKWRVAVKGRPASKERVAKQRLSIIAWHKAHPGSQKGRIASEETRIKMSKSATGRRLSETTKEKLRIIQTEYCKTHPLTLERIEKLRASRLGQSHSEEARLKISISKSANHPVPLEEMRNRYLTGESLSSLAKAYHCTTTRLNRLLLSIGVTPRTLSEIQKLRQAKARLEKQEDNPTK